jgi:hypothetical protein
LTTKRHRADLTGLDGLDTPDRLLLTVPGDSDLGAAVAWAPGGDLAASLGFTDIAPVAVPDRVRARVLLGGRLSLDHQGASGMVLCFTTVTAELEHGGQRFALGMDELAAAEPDPLAATEAELLMHLADAHGNAVELMAQLVDHRSRLGVTRVDPLRLDRYGIVLRLRRAHGYHDVRLPFSTPPQNPAHAILQMRALLAQAKACPRRSRR